MKKSLLVIVLSLTFNLLSQAHSQLEILSVLTKALNTNDFKLIEGLIPPTQITDSCTKVKHYKFDQQFVDNLKFNLNNFKQSFPNLKVDTIVISEQTKQLESSCSNNNFSHLSLFVSNNSQSLETIIVGHIYLIKFNDNFYLEDFDLSGNDSKEYVNSKREYFKNQIGRPFAQKIIDAITVNDIAEINNDIVPLDIVKFRLLNCQAYNEITSEQLNTYYSDRIVGKLKKRITNSKELFNGKITIVTGDRVTYGYPQCYYKDYGLSYSCEDEDGQKFTLSFVLLYEGGNYFITRLNFYKKEEATEEEK